MSGRGPTGQPLCKACGKNEVLPHELPADKAWPPVCGSCLRAHPYTPVAQAVAGERPATLPEAQEAVSRQLPSAGADFGDAESSDFG